MELFICMCWSFSRLVVTGMTAVLVLFHTGCSISDMRFATKHLFKTLCDQIRTRLTTSMPQNHNYYSMLVMSGISIFMVMSSVVSIPEPPPVPTLDGPVLQHFSAAASSDGSDDSTQWPKTEECKTKCQEYLTATTTNCSKVSVGFGHNPHNDGSICNAICSQATTNHPEIKRNWLKDKNWDGLDRGNKQKILIEFEKSFLNRQQCLNTSKEKFKVQFKEACVKHLKSIEQSSSSEDGEAEKSSAGEICYRNSCPNERGDKDTDQDNCPQYCDDIFKKFLNGCNLGDCDINDSLVIQPSAMVNAYLNESSDDNLSNKYLIMTKSYPMGVLDQPLKNYINQELFGDTSANQQNQTKKIQDSSKGKALLSFGVNCKGDCEQSCKQHIEKEIKESIKLCEQSSEDAIACCHSPLACSNMGDVVTPGTNQLRAIAMMVNANDQKALCKTIEIGGYAGAGLQGAMGAHCWGMASSCESTCEEGITKIKKSLDKFCGSQLAKSDQNQATPSIDDLTCDQSFLEKYTKKFNEFKPYIKKCGRTKTNGFTRLLNMPLEALQGYIASQANCGTPPPTKPTDPKPPTPPQLGTGSDTGPISGQAYRRENETNQKFEPEAKTQANYDLPDLDIPPLNNNNSGGQSAQGGLLASRMGGSAPPPGGSGVGGGGPRRKRGRGGKSSSDPGLQYRSSRFGGYGGGGANSGGNMAGFGRAGKGKNKKKRKMASLDLDKLMKKKKELNRLKNKYGSSHENLFKRISHRFQWACKYKMSCNSN